MKNKEQNENYINMDKDELIQQLNFKEKKCNKIFNYYNVIIMLLLIIVISNFMFNNMVFSSLKSFLITVMSSATILAMPSLYVKTKLKKETNKISSIKNQLENIATMDYEKERYKTDLEHKEKMESLEKNNDATKVDKISIDEYYNFKRKNELIKFREELEKLKVNNNIGAINSEIRHYKGKETSLLDRKIKLLIKEYKKDNKLI